MVTALNKRKKQKEEEELEDDEEPMEEGEYLDQPKEGEEPENELEEKDRELDELFRKHVDARFEKIENAISVNQKYIKQLWTRQNKLEEDFRLLVESK